jgi:exosortase
MELSSQESLMNLVKHHFWFLPIALGALVIWTYWTVLGEIVGKWSSPEYSHGFFVPLFAVFLLWWRRNQIVSEACSPSTWGLLLLALGAGLRVVGAYYYVEYLEMLSLLLCLLGLSVCLGGKRAMHWAWPSIAFLFFMLPLPFTLEVMLSGPLRRVAVVASTYVLQTFGFSAVAEGNIILMESQPILVAEACSGLSMLLTFFALSTGLAIVTKRSFVEKIVLVLSALPIAIIANIARIVLTATLAEMVGNKAANFVFHEVAGLLMMSFALCLLGTEVLIIDRMFVARQEGDPSSPSALDGFVPHSLPVAASLPVPVSSGKAT